MFIAIVLKSHKAIKLTRPAYNHHKPLSAECLSPLYTADTLLLCPSTPLSHQAGHLSQ